MNNIWDRCPVEGRTRALLESYSQRSGGSYLFIGPQGAGMSEAAEIFAAALMCPDDDGDCDICRRTIAGVHPDARFFEPEGFTYPVETIREITTSASHSPLEGSSRVFVIAEADRIAERSQNALLKSLEEPNASVTWVLLGRSLDMFLPTILSRCRVVEFPAMSEDAIRDALVAAGEVAPDPIVRAARGDLQRAIALAGEGAASQLTELAKRVVLEPEPSPSWVLSISDAVAAVAKAQREVLEQQQATQLEESDLGKGAGGVRKRIADRHKREVRRAESEVFMMFLSILGDTFRDLAARGVGAPDDALILHRSELD
ncbi:MAG TPA: AAA family ATPase, partial [Actinomycetota bacterium]|nr:AAA family ATPase [Actinomycetota bacterium]